MVLRRFEGIDPGEGKAVDGRGGGIRTPDPLLPKQMRYQTALRPDVVLRLYRVAGFIPTVQYDPVLPDDQLVIQPDQDPDEHCDRNR